MVALLAFTCGWASSARAQAGESGQAEPGWDDAEDVDGPALARAKGRGAHQLDPSAAQLIGADQDLQRWDQELRQVQRQTRAYLGSWIIGQSALTGVNLYIAMNAGSEARRAAYTVASALSAANLLYLLVQGWPALGSHRHFRRMPATTLSEKVAKATYAQEVILAQRNKDRMVNEIDRHVGAFVVGIGAGLGIGLGYKDLYEGLSLGIGIIGVAELLMLTRPSNYHRPERRPTFALKDVTMSPWADKHARGIGLAGRF